MSLLYDMNTVTKRKRYNILLFCLLVLSFACCGLWYLHSVRYAKNVQKRFAQDTAAVYDNIEQKGKKFITCGDSLVYWQDNTVPFYNNEQDFLGGSKPDDMIAELKNGFYLHKTLQSHDSVIHYFYLIKYKYPVSNKYLDNSFNPPFDLDNQTDIVFYQTDFPVIYKGKTVGYLEASPECYQASDKDSFVCRLWLALNIFLSLMFTLRFMHLKIKNPHTKRIVTVLLFIVFIITTAVLCKNNGSISFRLFTDTVNYNNILLFAVIALSGFFLFMLTGKIWRIHNKQKYYLVGQFSVIIIIAALGGSIVEFYSVENTKNSIEKYSQILIDADTDTDMKNFNSLMSAALNDTSVTRNIFAGDYARAENYVNKYYLNLLKEKNHTNILIFNPSDSMLLSPENKYINILFYIDGRLNSAQNVQGYKRLYKEEDNAKNNTYIFFDKLDDVYVFAECLHKENSENMNYSLLLSDNTLMPENTAYAKYSDGVLVYSYGEREFLNNIPPHQSGWSYDQNYNTYYKSKANITYAVCSDKFSVYKAMGSVSALFLLLLFLLAGEHYAKLIPHFKKKTLSIRYKILASLTGCFLVSVLISGFFSIRNTIDITNRNNISVLKGKTDSIQFELESLAANKGEITENDLIHLSNEFLVDINIFNQAGDLEVCSQKDVFEKGIVSYKIDRQALVRLKNEGGKPFYRKEEICKGKFLSSYCTLNTKDGSNVLYLNIPFINQQKIVSDNINGLINGFANMLLFWINIAVIIFVFLSNIITKPLELVKKQMGTFSITHRNDKIKWNKDDEMGDLIKAYNMMIDKAEESTLLMQQQQRQSAWRELAKQVAHDIKNPLTPMKLSIQYLQKLYNEKPEMFGKKWQQTAPSLISQIESISTITQELNSYSKPSVKKEKVDLDKCITAAITLFDNIDNVNITYHSVKQCFVLGEENLFIRIFNNLIKNAVQSFYNQSEGKIDIAIEENSAGYTVSVEDNGCGIKEEYKSQVFNTDFTTKSEGGGIGLTIVKIILESYGASISFQSEENVGTVFFITFDKFNA